MADYRPVAPKANTGQAPVAPMGRVNTGNNYLVNQARSQQSFEPRQVLPVQANRLANNPNASKAQVARLTEEGKLSPLDYLASIYQNESEDIRLRVEAAKAAAPYVHARLASTEVRAAVTGISQEEWLTSLK